MKPSIANLNTEQARAEALEKLRELIAEINFAMLTTVSADRSLRSRPMATLQFDTQAGELWFFATDDSPKVDEISIERQVGLSYSEPSKQSYVSVSGRATLLRDTEKAAELWTPMAKLWFPKGLDDPRLVLLCVEIESAEYWDAPANAMVQLYELAKRGLSGEGEEEPLGEDVKIDRPLRRP